MTRRASFVADDGCKRSLAEAGLVSIDSVFAFSGGKDLAKANIGQWRKRIELRTSDGTRFFLKRYQGAGVLEQTKSWLVHGRRASFASFDVQPGEELAGSGIMTPKVAASGEEWGVFFEKRSFSITQEVTQGESLERRLPSCFRKKTTAGLREKRKFLSQLGRWAAKFHATGWRHRDFYLAHIFRTDEGELYLIDLQRAFKPEHLAERYRRKDIAQLYYSMPRGSFSQTDRMRVYHAYADVSRLRRRDKRFIRGVIEKAGEMTLHDERHGKVAPYKGKA